MSGKYSKKKASGKHSGNTGKKASRKNKNKVSWKHVIIAAIGLVALILYLAYMLGEDPAGNADLSESNAALQTTAPLENNGESLPVQIDTVEEVSVDLGNGLVISDIGKYTGIYMEDGTDEIVSGVLMIAVTNNGEQDVQYAEIYLTINGQTASFSLSTLPVGETAILLEQNRMPYTTSEFTDATVKNTAYFKEPLSLCEDRISIQVLDGVINVSNISDTDITGDICIYYKNRSADVYYGGITYMVRIPGGLLAGEVRQLMASHFSESGSVVMFVTFSE